MRSFPRFLTACFLVLVLCAAPAAFSQDLPELPSADDPIEVDALTRAARALTILSESGTPDVDAASADLAEGGEDMIPCLLVLRHRFSRPEHVEATVGALARLGASEIESYLHFHLGTSRDPAVRSQAYRLLGTWGTPAGVPSLLAAMQNDSREDQAAAREALAAVLRRPNALPAHAAIETVWEELSTSTQGRVAAALADADTEDAFETLKGLVGDDAELDPILFSAIGRMETHTGDLGFVESVAKGLESSSPMVRKMATTVLGRLEDPGAVPRLIDLLESGDAGLRKDAYWSLRNITGMEFPPNGARWRVWYQREMDWWWTEGQELLEDLRSEDDRIAVRAILLFARRPFFRRAVEGELTGLASGGSEKARVVAKSALSRLGLDADPSSGLQLAAARARLLDPSARPVDVVGRQPAPPIRIGPGAGFPLPLLILGLLVVVYLVWRIFGRTLFARIVGMRQWVVDPGQREGPMTITVERRPRGQGRGGNSVNTARADGR